MDIRMIKVMVIALVITLPITGVIIHIIDQKDKAKVNIGASLHAKKSRSNLVYNIYRYLNINPITRGYVSGISRRYELLFPADGREIAKRSIRVVLISWGLCTFALISIFLLKPNFNNAAVSLILVFVINNEVISFLVNRAEVNLLSDMAVFISDVRHNYHINRMIDDAIEKSLDNLSFEMKVHANRLYEIVTSNDLREDVINYNATMHNKYLKMFLSLCTSVLEYSDKKVNGQLLFTANLEHLKREINIEILKQKKIRYLFSGVTFVTIAVITPIDIIKKFGISMMPELDQFYNGSPGIIFVTVTLFTALIIYLLNDRLKEMKHQLPKDTQYLKKLENIHCIKRALDNYSEKHYGKMLVLKDTLKRIGETLSPRQLLLQRMILATAAFLFSILFFLYIHENNRFNAVDKINNVASLTSAANVKQQDRMKDMIHQMLDKYNRVKGVTEETVYNDITATNTFYNTVINRALAKEVMLRVSRYQGEYFKFFELMICLGVMVIAYYIPFWLVLYRKRVLQLNMEDEVNQFNSIIYMLMFIDHITVKDLLEELELFALVFKQSLQECINDYNSGDIEALERMKEKETFGPFKRLVDNLIRCDTISIDKAFDEISSDRENYHDRRKQENEISVQKRADIAKPLSFVPTVLIMIYLTLPLLMASLNMLKGFSNMINSV